MVLRPRKAGGQGSRQIEIPPKARYIRRPLLLIWILWLGVAVVIGIVFSIFTAVIIAIFTFIFSAGNLRDRAEFIVSGAPGSPGRGPRHPQMSPSEQAVAWRQQVEEASKGIGGWFIALADKVRGVSRKRESVYQQDHEASVLSLSQLLLTPALTIRKIQEGEPEEVVNATPPQKRGMSFSVLQLLKKIFPKRKNKKDVAQDIANEEKVKRIPKSEKPAKRIKPLKKPKNKSSKQKDTVEKTNRDYLSSRYSLPFYSLGIPNRVGFIVPACIGVLAASFEWLVVNAYVQSVLSGTKRVIAEVGGVQSIIETPMVREDIPIQSLAGSANSYIGHFLTFSIVFLIASVIGEIKSVKRLSSKLGYGTQGVRIATSVTTPFKHPRKQKQIRSGIVALGLSVLAGVGVGITQPTYFAGILGVGISVGLILFFAINNKASLEKVGSSYNAFKEEVLKWQGVWVNALTMARVVDPDGLVPKFEYETDYGTFKQAIFKLLADNSQEYRKVVEGLSYSLGARGAIYIEGVNKDGDIVPIAHEGDFLMLRYSLRDEFASGGINRPHLDIDLLKSGGRGGDATRDLNFAVSLAIKNAFDESEMESPIIGQVEMKSNSDKEGSPIAVAVVITVPGSQSLFTDAMKKLDHLKQSIGADYLNLAPTSSGSEWSLWYSNETPSNIRLADEIGTPAEMDGEIVASSLPGGRATEEASEIRKELVAMEWSRIWRLCGVANPPLLISQTFEPGGEFDGVAEALFESYGDINVADSQKRLRAIPDIDGVTLFLQVLPDGRTLQLRWGINCQRNAYLSELASEILARHSLGFSIASFFSSSSGKSPPSILNVYRQERFFEVVCREGSGTSLTNVSSQSANLQAALSMGWLRVGETLHESKNLEDGDTFSIFCAENIPEEIYDTEEGRRVAELNIREGFVATNPAFGGMKLYMSAPLDQDASTLETIWELPSTADWAAVFNAKGKIVEKIPTYSLISRRVKRGARSSKVSVVLLKQKDPSIIKWKMPAIADWVMGALWEETFSEAKIESAMGKNPPSLKSIERITDKLTKFIFELPRGMAFDEIYKKNDTLLTSQKFQYLEIIPGQEMGDVDIVCSHEDPLPSKLSLGEVKMTTDKDAWKQIPIGRGVLENVVWDVTVSPHLLVCGRTGSGKTVTLKSLISNAWSLGFRIFLGDGKGGGDFNGLADSGVVEKFSTQVEDIFEICKDAVGEIERRKNNHHAKGLGNWHEEDVSIRESPILFVLDESYTLLESSKGQTISDRDKKLKEMKIYLLENIGYIAREGRAFGVHLVLAAQKPYAEVIKGEIKNNLGSRILLGAPYPADIEMMFPDSQIPTVNYRKPGRGILYNDGADCLAFQSPFMEEKLLIKKLKEAKNEFDSRNGENVGGAVQAIVVEKENQASQ